MHFFPGLHPVREQADREQGGPLGGRRRRQEGRQRSQSLRAESDTRVRIPRIRKFSARFRDVTGVECRGSRKEAVPMLTARLFTQALSAAAHTY